VAAPFAVRLRAREGLPYDRGASSVGASGDVLVHGLGPGEHAIDFHALLVRSAGGPRARPPATPLSPSTVRVDGVTDLRIDVDLGPQDR
jgi:hypothetical protein